MKEKNKRIAVCGVFTGLAMIFSYVEMLLPVSIGIPGVKLGLANCCVIVILYFFGWREASIVNLLRIGLTGLLFGNFTSFVFSFTGGMLSLLVMIGLKKTGYFSMTAVSIAGGVVHNIGQIGAAAFLMANSVIVYYLPVLLIAGVVTGLAIGILGSLIAKRLGRHIKAA